MIRNKRLQLAHWIAKLFDTHLPYFKGTRQIRDTLTRMLAPMLQSPQRISTRYGFDMVIASVHDSIDYHLYARGTYEAGTLNIISQCLNEGDVFLDVGANIGLMSLLAATRVGRSGTVYAFEPVPDTFRLLQANISLNQLKNIYAINVGLGSTQGTEMIYRNRHNNRGMASFIEGDRNTTEQTKVPVFVLDDFLIEYRVGVVKMIKIDVEGWELEVLKGAPLLLSGPEAPILCIEYNTQLPQHKVIYELIASSKVYQLYVLPHGNWHASRLARVYSIDDLPAISSFNIYCFLPVHLQMVPADLFIHE